MRAWIPCFLAYFVVLAQSSLALSQVPMSSPTGTKDCLFDMPVSNNGARCRIILYKKGIQDKVDLVSPLELGGLRSEAYLQLNPQAKMPALRFGKGGGAIAESDTIARYLLDKYPEGPSFQLHNPQSNFIARLHDLYLTTIQGCMYKAVGPFGAFATRKDALAEYVRQWNIINDLVDENSFYLCGTEVSLADATVFPSAVFAAHMLPKFDVSPALPSKIDAWFQRLKTQDPAFSQVYNEIQGALDGWDKKGRWDTILGAGLRDNEPGSIFDKIVAKDIPATIVKEDDKIMAFKDINPAAPAHILVIPKDRTGLTRLSKATAEHTEILGRLMVAAGEIARDESLGFGNGARIVINDGPDGGQEVYHLHVHVLGGRSMQWPPG